MNRVELAKMYKEATMMVVDKKMENKQMLEMFLEMAVETKRDLHITVNTDGAFEVDMTIPTRYKSSSEGEPIQEDEHGKVQ